MVTAWTVIGEGLDRMGRELMPELGGFPDTRKKQQFVFPAVYCAWLGPKWAGLGHNLDRAWRELGQNAM